MLMMSDDSNRIWAPSRRRETIATTAYGQERRGVPPMQSAHMSAGRRRLKQFYILRALNGGVPSNTERTTVKPWVGSAS